MDFKKLIRLLMPMVVEGVLAVKQNSKDRLVEMFNELEFITRSINQTSEHLIIELQILDKNLFYKLLAGEANKFLLASRISYARAIQNQENNASWQTIEHYYSAYYSIHYLLRLTGVSLTNLDNESIAIINRCLYGIETQTQVKSGLYVMHYDDASSILTLKKNIKKSLGGSHQDAWKLWENLVIKLNNQTQTDLAEYLSISIDLTAHRNFLVRSTAKYNPPDIRGEINYQFKGGSWIFENKSQESIKRIQRSIASQEITQPTKNPSPEGLVASNKMIIGLAKAIFQHAADRYPTSICRSLANKYSLYVS